MGYARPTAIALLALILLGSAGAAAARPRDRLDIPEQSLDQALRRLAHDARVEILFDFGQVSGRRSRGVRGELSPEQALSMMLGGLDLAAKRTSTGGYVIISADTKTLRLPRAPDVVASEPPTTVAEILVVGRQSQNVDIRRGVNDIQPYKVLGSSQILDAQADDLEDLLRQRLTSNTVIRTLGQAPVANFASNRSHVNISGFSTAQTLVLIDGRRLPATPEAQNFGQPDLNGIPRIAIERIETLSGTAGGIYGPGATGGVVNIVLKRNYSGGEFETGAGVTQRGDAPQWRAGLMLGGSWLEDRLHLSVTLAREHTSGLAFGDRRYVERSRAARYANGTLNLPVSNAWNLLGFVVIDPDHAGGYSTAPLTLAPDSSAGMARFVANVGTLDLALTDDGQGRSQSLLTSATTTSIILSGRLKLGDRLQVFSDLLAVQNTGRAVGPRQDTARGLPAYLSDGETFPWEVRINFPTPNWSAPYANRSRSVRATVGAILRFGRTWSAELDAAAGQAQIRTSQPANGALLHDLAATGFDLLRDYQGLQAILASYADLPNNKSTSSDRLIDVSLRAGGELGRAWGGPVTLTTLVEARQDRIPTLALAELTNNLPPIPPDEWGNPGTVPVRTAPEVQTVYSAYAELRAPLIRRDSAPWLVRGLEGQLAVRGDHYAYDIPVFNFKTPTVTSRDTTTSATLGFRAWPTDDIMLRGSYATGYAAPSLADMTPNRDTGIGASNLDPRRPGQIVGANGDLALDYNGSPRVRPERARAITAGAVIATPDGSLRASMDFTHLVKTREVVHFFDFNIQYVLEHEADDPGRVTRAPLTEADRAQGLTAGVVTEIDTASGNLGRSVTDMLQIDIDHRLVTSAGVFNTFLALSWTPRFRRRTNPDLEAFDMRRALDGPLPARAAFGTSWTRGGWTIGLSGQAYGGTRVSYADTDLNYTVSQYGLFNVRANGGDKVPPQIYFDGDVAYRASMSNGRELVYRLGARNLLDQKPPLVTTPISPSTNGSSSTPLSDAGLGYSTLGDPRGRRFVASIQVRF